MKTGVLYGLGVGPGNSDLVPVGSARKLGEVSVVFAASSSKNDYSHALNVVKPFLSGNTEIQMLDFPMTRDREVLEAAWDKNARQVADVLKSGRDAAFITIGDSLTFSTWSYLMATLQEFDASLQCRTLPGIPAYHAAAACLNLPLVEGAENMMVFPAVRDLDRFIEFGNSVDTLIVMKAYRNFDALLDAVSGMEGKRQVIAASNIGLADEQIEMDAFALRGRKMPYLTMLIVKRIRGEGE